ncbi:MAG TPA: AAA family ATPase [Candidatus Angelobacter sp.]|nr:AAA family ATPase [Candidatus Angelobacter sp.]
MSIERIVEIIYSNGATAWRANNEKALEGLFGSPHGRYPANADKVIQLRAPEANFESGVPFAAYIHPNNPTKGPYGGLSFVIFPSTTEPALIGLVVGTQGLAPDEAVLGRPGHARKAQAICAWLNAKFGGGKLVAWAKQDPTRTDIAMPGQISSNWPEFKDVFDRYGHVIYAIFKPAENRKATQEALTAFLDLMFEERRVVPNTPHRKEADQVRREWFEYLMPQVGKAEVKKLLDERRFVVLQGPPGTGKTTMAQDLWKQEFREQGKIVQLHPNTTYETFIGGLAPASSIADSGFRFAPKPGFLIEAAKAATKARGTPYLLVLDEINRADLGKILGEAIFLLEPHPLQKRTIELAYDFGEPFGSKLEMPENLFILGTMNSADRSIAIVDVAIRRRFAFVSLWPQIAVVKTKGCELMQGAFQKLVDIFVEYAQEDAFNLIPGHSYFLESDEDKAKVTLKTGLMPLLEEYLAQGYIGGFSEPVRAYLQEIRSL